MRLSAAVMSLLLVLASPAPPGQSSPPGAATEATVALVGPEGAQCGMEVLHPLQVQVHLVEALVPGQWLRAEVQVQSDLDLVDVEVLLTNAAAVEIAGSHKVAWTELASATPRTWGFDLRVVDTPAPQQVQVLVRGSSGGAEIERGAVLHLLPRGQHHPPVVSDAPSGSRTVLEYRGAARRAP